MTNNIKHWSSIAQNNTDQSVGGFKEFELPNKINDSGRLNVASVKTWHDSAEWVDIGSTPVYRGTNSFAVSGDLRSTYDTGRRVVVSCTSTVYGTILSSTYSSGFTKVFADNDAGDYDASITSVAIGICKRSNRSINRVTSTYSNHASSAGFATSASIATTVNFLSQLEYTSTSFSVPTTSIEYLTMKAVPGRLYFVQVDIKNFIMTNKATSRTAKSSTCCKIDGPFGTFGQTFSNRYISMDDDTSKSMKYTTNYSFMLTGYPFSNTYTATMSFDFKNFGFIRGTETVHVGVATI